LSADLEASFKGDPGPLIFAVPSLNLFMFARLYFLFQDLGPPTLVHTGDLENLRRIEPAVILTTHHGDAVDLHFVYVHAGVCGLSNYLALCLGA